MAFREFYQNMVDFIVIKTGVVSQASIRFSKATFDAFDALPSRIKTALAGTNQAKAVRQSKSVTVYTACFDSIEYGCVAVFETGFFFLQHDSTLFPGHLLQRTSKGGNASLAGAHGCGMKEAALCLLADGASLKFFMPADPDPAAESPGDIWTWGFGASGVLRVRSHKSKRYKARDLLIVAHSESYVVSDFFHEADYLPLFFNTSADGEARRAHATQKKVRAASNAGEINQYAVGVMNDPINLPLAGRFYNHGIFVSKLEEDIARSLPGVFLDSEFKLSSRYRNTIPKMRSHVVAAIRLALLKSIDACRAVESVLKVSKHDVLPWMEPPLSSNPGRFGIPKPHLSTCEFLAFAFGTAHRSHYGKYPFFVNATGWTSVRFGKNRVRHVRAAHIRCLSLKKMYPLVAPHETSVCFPLDRPNRSQLQN